jgi:hypothetical protein
MALLNRRAIKSPERRFPAGAEVEDAKAAHAKQAARAARAANAAKAAKVTPTYHTMVP